MTPDPNKADFCCDGKVRFESESMASKVSQRSRHKHHTKIAPYRCRFCGGWHIGQHLSASFYGSKWRSKRG